jgi:hypothetical protein
VAAVTVRITITASPVIFSTIDSSLQTTHVHAQTAITNTLQYRRLVQLVITNVPLAVMLIQTVLHVVLTVLGYNQALPVSAEMVTMITVEISFARNVFITVSPAFPLKTAPLVILTLEILAISATVPVSLVSTMMERAHLASLVELTALHARTVITAVAVLQTEHSQVAYFVYVNRELSNLIVLRACILV